MGIPNPQPEPLYILAFGAHPDDTDIGCSGTLALHAEQGLRVGVCDLTHAELSSNGTVELRQQEAKIAAQATGLAVRLTLTLPDRGLRITDDTIRELVHVIRTYQPTYVFAPDFEDRHPDHRTCATLVEEAVFSAGLARFESDGSYPAHKVKEVFYYAINGIHAPDLAVDVTSVVHKKAAALAAYGSQFDPQQGTRATPLNQGMVAAIHGRDALVGHQCGAVSAEGFRVKRPILLKSLQQLHGPETLVGAQQQPR